MCGIAGFIDAVGFGAIENATAIAHAMEQNMLHRWPNAGDCWLDAEAGIALVYRRLSIIDFSSAGAQPMWLWRRWQADAAFLPPIVLAQRPRFSKGVRQVFWCHLTTPAHWPRQWYK